jgi:TatD-related deoxyribonuclease|tara:strand:- start:4086 stop:4976 length:891 start_codon:yes stop_codon:yes gene_type:complete
MNNLVSDKHDKSLQSSFNNFTDNHLHIDPINGEGLLAVKKFQRAGGKHLFLVCKTTRDLGLEPNNLESFEKLFNYTIRLSVKINQETEVKSFPVLGVHPAEIVDMCNKFSVTKAVGIAVDALNIAGHKVENREATAIGEVGIPHFIVEDSIKRACDKVLIHAFQVSRDLDCAVQVHSDNEAGIFEYLYKIVKEAKIHPNKVVKHFSNPTVLKSIKEGIYPSMIARNQNIIDAKKEGNRFFMESDYIDDLQRPGAVLGPKTVPKLSTKLFNSGVLSEEDLWRIHVDNVEDVYGVTLV